MNRPDHNIRLTEKRRPSSDDLSRTRVRNSLPEALEKPQKPPYKRRPQAAREL